MFAALKARLAPFYDPTAWTLIIIGAGAMWLIDPVLVKTVLQWVILFAVFAGIAVMISMHVFPQIKLTQHVEEALKGNAASGLVVLGICIVVSFLLLALTLWGKA